MRTLTTYGQAVAALTLASATSLGGCAPDRDASRASDSRDREQTARVAQPLAWFETELTPLDGMLGDGFGVSVAVSENTVIAGAPGVNAAYVFVRSNTWQPQAKLVPIGAIVGDGFGGSVAISGDIAIVGAPGVTGPHGVYQGAAYVFVRSGTLWGEPVTLTANDGGADDRFGSSVAISEGRAIVGSPYASGGYGAAYVFTQSGADWNQTKLAASDGLAGYAFGISVAISGATALVGAYGDWEGGSTFEPGAAYVFTDSGTAWDEQKLVASDALAGDEFGYSVAISGDMAVVGARGALGKTAPNGYRQGAAYVFVNSVSGWTPQGDILFADDAMNSDEFGISVAVSGSTALVGAYADSVYVFAPLASAAVQQVLGGRGSRPNFGYPLALDGNLAAVGTVAASSVYVEAFLATDGSPCGSDTECGNHHCVSNVCCDLPCSGACETCSSGACTALPQSSGTPSCAPYLCGASGSACPTSCDSSGDCIETHYCLDGECVVRQPHGATCTESRHCASGQCIAGKCLGPLPNGAPCSGAADCGSGHCTDGVCCDEACGQQCEACDLPDGPGECMAVTGAPRGEREPCAGSGETCGGACDGENTIGCAYPTATTACGSSCADGIEIPSDCNGQGDCVAGAPHSCGNFVCADAVSCKTSCESDGDCRGDLRCGADAQCAPSVCVGPYESKTSTDDTPHDCRPYVCDTSGACKTSCASVSDCAEPNVCNLKQRCVPRPTDRAGCGCRLALRASHELWTLGSALALLLLARSRARWRRR